MLIKICGFIAIALYTLLGIIQCVKIDELEKRINKLDSELYGLRFEAYEAFEDAGRRLSRLEAQDAENKI